MSSRIETNDDTAAVVAATGAGARRAVHDAHVAARRRALEEHVRAGLAEIPKTGAIVLEVCCGHGHFLTDYAATHPETPCIGVDFCRNRVARAQRKRMRAQLANLWFCCAEANEFLDSLPTRVVFSRVFMLFPDPWPKKRHQKHRLLAEPFLSRLASKVQDRADLFFRTDCADYFEWSLTAVREHPGWRLDPDHTWPFECETVFQARAAAVHSLVAIRA